MRTQAAPRRRVEPLSVQLLAQRDTSGAPLPLPLLFSPRTPEQQLLHDRIYHVVALALRAYMLAWYAKISPRDRVLLPVVNRDIVAPLVGPLLASLAEEDDAGRDRILDLALLHAPVLLATHVEGCWGARADTEVFGVPLGEAYHARVPTLAAAKVDGIYVLNPAYTAALVDALLALRLPTADYASGAERLVVREVVARAVLGSVGKRLAAPWFYAQLALKLLGAPGEPLPWRKGKGEGKTASREPITPRKILDTARRAYIALATGLTVLYTLGAWLVAFMREAPPPQRRYTRVADGPMALARTLIGIDGRSGLAAPTWPTRLVFAAVEVLVALLSPVLDRLGPALAARALTAKTGLRVVDLVERILFPDGWPSPPPIEPTPEEARVLDAQFRRRVDEVLPAFVKRAITAVLGENAADALVDIVSDYECNAHLVALLLPAIVAALVPELLAHEPEKPLITEPIVENTPTDTIDIHDQ